MNYKKNIKKMAACCLSVAMAAGSIFAHWTPAEVYAAESFTNLDRSNWELTVESSYAGDPKENMIDGNADTKWETDWTQNNAFVQLPVDIIVNLGAVEEDVSRVLYLPRQDNQYNGKIMQFEIYTGLTENEMELAAKGTWDTSGAEKTATFTSRDAQFVKIKVITAGQNPTALNEQTVTCAELNVATCADVVVNDTALAAKIAEMRNTIDATENELIKQLLQNELSEVENVDTANFTLEAYNALIAQLDNAMENYTDADFLTIPQNNLSVAYKTSEYSGNPITYIFDGQDDTFWETGWGTGATLFQKGDYFIIDLGQSREHVARIIYTPRQDSSNGRIKEYEIYTSNASSLNGSDLEANGFTLAGKGAWEADALTKTASFNSRTARYVAVKVNSVGGDGATITCAEFNVALKMGMAVDTTEAANKIKEVEDMIANSDNEIVKTKLQAALNNFSGSVSDYTQEGIASLIVELQEAVDTYANIGKVDSIRPGKAWVDTDGERIQAHGSNIIYDENTKTYYWYGEHKGADNIATGAETGTPAIGISCYSSKDLYNWKNEGVALPVFNNPQIVDGTGTDETPLYLSEKSEAYQNSTLPEYGTYTAISGQFMKAPFDTLSQYNTDEYIAKANALYADLTLAEKREIYEEFNWNRVVERPKVVYNKNTGKYVMWWHQDGPTVGQYTVASAGVAISDSPTGPFKYLGTSRLPNTGNSYGSGGEGMLRDMTLFADDDGTGYLIYSSEDNATTIILKLNDDYTAPAGTEEGVHYVRVFQGIYREAPAVFKDGETYYMITSGQSGWNPNPCKYAYSTNGIMGNWSEPQYFCIDDITLNNEPAADQGAGTTYRSQSTHILPVRDADGTIVPGKFIYMGDRWFRENLKDSRYIWLPINLDSESHTLTMEWKDEWKIGEEFGVTEVSPETEPEEIPHEHVWGNWTTVTEATVSAPKAESRTCSSCGAAETHTVGSKLDPVISTNAVKDKITLQKKQTAKGFQITELANGDSIVSITSSNKKVVKVTKVNKAKGTCTLKAGKLTGKKGKATLTITLASGLEKNIKVTVQTAKVKTTKIAGLDNYKKISLVKGKSLTLKPVLEPFTSQDKVKFTSSNSKVVKVTSKGKLTAKKKGKATIKVQAGKKTFKVKVTVK